MSRILIPNSTDWLTSFNARDGLVMYQGRLAELLHPELWEDTSSAYTHPLDQHPFDYSGNNNHGIRINGVTDHPDSWDVNGTDGYMDIATSAGLPSGQEARAIVVWVFQRTRTSGENAAVVELTAPSGQAFMILLALLSGDTYIFTDAVNGNNNVIITGSEIPSLNAWHCIVFMFNGAVTWSYYLDGELVKNGVYGTTINTNTNGLGIGRRETGATGYIDGLENDIHVYNRDLTQQRIRLLSTEQNIAYQCRLLPKVFVTTVPAGGFIDNTTPIFRHVLGAA